MMRRIVCICVLALIWAASGVSPARAATCDAVVSDFNFGSVTLRSGAVNRTSGTLRITCSDPLLSVVGVCVRFGPGSGGAGANNNPRYLRHGGGAALPYQLRLGGYGTGFGTLNETFLSVTTLLGSTGSVTVPIYAEILEAGTSFDAGWYESVFSGTSNIEMSYGVLSCDLFAQSRPVPDFRVTANAVSSCELDVGTMNFGNLPSLALGPVDAVAPIDVRCTEGTNYTVSLGLGDGVGVTDPALWRMTNGLSTLAYGLYRDPSRTQVWGALPGTRATGVGSGSNQRYNVYGRIHAGQTTVLGTYTDNVVVTVNY